MLRDANGERRKHLFPIGRRCVETRQQPWPQLLETYATDSVPLRDAGPQRAMGMSPILSVAPEAFDTVTRLICQVQQKLHRPTILLRGIHTNHNRQLL